MNPSKSKQPDPLKAVNSVFDLAFGDQQEAGKQTSAEVNVALKSLGVNTDAGWQSLQAMIKTAQGKARLASAKQARIQSQEVAIKPSGILSTAQALIDEIKGALLLSGGQAAVFARKAESMPLEDLQSLRDQIIRTAARAAKKERDET